MTFIDRAVGIDLGTTNSAVAMLDPSEREIFVCEDAHRRRTVPSVVAWDGDQWLVGRAARRRRGLSPGPIESIKRKMGQVVTVDVGPGAPLSPEAVSAKILAEVRDRMRAFLAARIQGGLEARVDRAVITVPAYFDAPQVEATRRAAELAGLEPIGILQEPTAAAIYHTYKRKLGDGTFLVYDLGGGTFDVSILRCVAGEYQVLAIDGDNYLGGDDFDRRFAEHLRGELAARGYALALDVAGDPADAERFKRLVELAQEVKEQLSTRDVVAVSRRNLLVDQNGEDVEYEGEIGRAGYEEVIGRLVETTIESCLRAVSEASEKAGVALADIDNVILVGGSTRVPLVARRVTEALCGPSRAEAPLHDEVDTCVALGAAVHAAQLGGVRVGDPEAAACVCFTSPLVARETPLKLALVVESAPEETREVAVARGDDILVGVPYTGDADATLRMDVPLTEAADLELMLELRDDDGELLAALPFAVHRGDVRPRASALSRPAVLSKDIALEVVRAQRRERKTLLPKGTGLPMKVEQRFFTSDRSGAVVLRLLQGRMPIKTLMLEVPADLAVGSEVKLSIRCDEAMRLEARAEVGGQELWATLEPPTPPRFDPKGDVEGLLEQAEAAKRTLWGSRADFFRHEVDQLTAAIREVVTIDPDKLRVLCQRLQMLVDEFEPDPAAGGLAPPLHHFEFELDSLRRVVFRASGSLMGMDREAWEARIQDVAQRASHAYELRDAVGWRRVNNEVQALRETATQEEFSALRIDDPAYLMRRLTSAVRRANEVERNLRDFVPSAADEVAKLQREAQVSLLADLKANVADPLSAMEIGAGDELSKVRRQLEAIGGELERIDTAIARIPSLGLVTERGDDR